MTRFAVGVGQSFLEDSFEAGREAAAAALRRQGDRTDVLLIFADPHFNHRALLAGVVDVTGTIPMVGGTTAGEISEAGFTSGSVVVMALGSRELMFSTGIGQDMSKGEETSARSLVEDLRRQSSLDQAFSLLIFPNGMGGDGVKVIKGLQSALDPSIEIVGGFLGDGLDFGPTFQFFNGQVYKDAMPGLLIRDGQRFTTGVGVRSGFESIGNRFYCTESDGNVAYRFDDRPALDLYKLFLGEDLSQRLPEVALEFPFGLIDEKVSIAGEEYFQLRAGLAVDHERGSITLAGSIPPGGAITLTTASRGDLIDGARLAAEQAKDGLRGARPVAVLMFSCVGRRLVLGRRTTEEVDAVRRVLGADVPLIGFYTYGEIGPIDKLRPELAGAKFHNETVVLWVLGVSPEVD